MRMEVVCVAAGLCLAGAVAMAGEAGLEPFDHSSWDRLLADAVQDGRVAYGRLVPRAAELAAYTRRLALVPPDALAAWPREARLAFYLNAYNAIVVEAVVQRYPLRSVKEVRGFFDRLHYRVAGVDRTLNELEGFIREDARDARVHFGLVCASRSCPALEPAAFHAEDVGPRLEAAARAFLHDPQRNVIDPARKTLRLSQIFDWYASDFIAEAGSVRAAVARWCSEAERVVLLDPATRLAFLPYDWRLNDRP